MNKIKSFKLFESEISWKSFEEFLNDVQDVFVEIMDDDILISEYGQYSFIYQDDDVSMIIMNQLIKSN